MSSATMTEELTLLEAVARRLRDCASTPDGVDAPVGVLWTDPEREWLPIVEALKERVPELCALGEYDPECRMGPAIWLRCVVDGTVELPGSPRNPDQVPVLYLPGVARQHLRAGDDCPRSLQPLVELMYRGTLWLQKGGHDWTVTAFLTSPNGLGLDLARDQQTLDALPRALREVAETPLDQLRGRRLEAEDFDRLLTSDVFRDLLRWMGDPQGWRERVGPERWEAFRGQCRAKLDFDPATEGELAAGSRLGGGEDAWDEAWRRYEEAPRAYPGVPEVLRRSRPANLFLDRSRWPDENETAEASLRAALEEVPDLPHVEACDRVAALEEEHGERREWVWSELSEAPLATVLEPLAVLATHVRTAVGGATPEEIARTYVGGAWRADAATWRALSLVSPANEGLIREVVRALLRPWLDESARAFQRAVESHPLPDHAEFEPVEVAEGECLVFVDGLRYDLGQELAERLEGRGCRVRVGHRWAALPTVTATAKPASTPVAGAVGGASLPEEFAPSFSGTGRSATASEIRKELEAAGFQLLASELGDWPASDTARGWSEQGQIDRLGHKLEVRLAEQIPGELERLVERVVGLFEAGWDTVRVVTDHGWLLLPGGLPKIDLPKHLTQSRWSRCATIAGQSQVSVPTAPWHWNPDERFATAPGITCFNRSPAYMHGGLSVQECLIPHLFVERSDRQEMRATIEDVTWRGMRCFVDASVAGGVVRADLRKGGALGASIAASVKEVDEHGGASLVVPNDEHEGADATLVLVGEEGTVLAQRNTRVGEMA